MKTEFVFEAGATAMKMLKGSYSCITIFKVIYNDKPDPGP